MNQKVKGILSVVGLALLFIILTLIVGAITAVATPDNPWMGMAGAMITLAIGGIIMLVLLVYGVIQYQKTKSDFGLGILYGFIGIVILNIVLMLLANVYNLFV